MLETINVDDIFGGTEVGTQVLSPKYVLEKTLSAIIVQAVTGSCIDLYFRFILQDVLSKKPELMNVFEGFVACDFEDNDTGYTI